MSKYTDAVERGLQGLIGVSTGLCPGCTTCADDHGFDPDDPSSMESFQQAWQSCEIESQSSFSWRPCGICGTTLGGDREMWHWIDPNDPERNINHESDACTDCVLFLANGDLPEAWRASQYDEPDTTE